MIWPDMPVKRLIRYYQHRVGRLSGSPYFIAAGFASGVAISFTPFIGLHLALGGAVAWVMRGSLIAMFVGSLIGNPWTLPFIWIFIYKIGVWTLGWEGRAVLLSEAFSFSTLMEKPLDLLLPMTVGCILPFLLSWIVSFYLVRGAVAAYQENRLRKIKR